MDGRSVSVHALQQAEGTETQWVKRDVRSLADRFIFLGKPSSFAVDAARFGVSSGGGGAPILSSRASSMGASGASRLSNAAVCSGTASRMIGRNSSSSSQANGTTTPACGLRRHNLPLLQLR